MKKIGNNNLYVCFYGKQLSSFAIIKEFKNRKELEDYYHDISELIDKKNGKMIVCFAFDSEGENIELLHNSNSVEMLVNEEWTSIYNYQDKELKSPVTEISESLENYLALIKYYVIVRNAFSVIDKKIVEFSATGSLGTKMKIEVNNLYL